MKKTFKAIIIISVLLISGLVTANILNYFGSVESTIENKQSVTIDHKPYTKAIKHNIKLQNGDSVVYQHTIFNDAKMCNVSINQSTTGTNSALTLRIYHNGTLVQFPIELQHESSITLDFEYSADINLKPKSYTVRTIFTVSEL